MLNRSVFIDDTFAEAFTMRAARIELGSRTAVKDDVRDVGWETALDTAWQAVRYAARTLRRTPTSLSRRC